MRRLYLSIIFVVLGSLFLVSWGLDKLVATNSEAEENNDIVFYKQLIDGFHQELALSSFESIKTSAERLSKNFQVNITIENSNNVALPKALEHQLSQPGGLLLASENNAYLLRKIAQHPSMLIKLTVPTENTETQSFDIFLTVILYLSVCSILILWLLPLTRRLYLLNSAAAKIGEGNFDIRIAKSRFSYIQMLEKSFNQMAGQIEKLIADNKILARSLSHDIRTPMACLRFGVEAALDTNDINKKNKYLARMDDEITRMENMTSAFLEYASLERHGFHLRLAPIDLNTLIQSIEHDCQPLAEQKHIKLSCQLSPVIAECVVDFHWCYRAIQNLVSNATQYAKSQVLLSVIVKTHTIEITIEDDGKGIPDDKLEVIFQPFIKLDDDSSREDGHFGLGLAITTKVIDWHHAKISASRSPLLSGACFTLKFPLKHS